MKIAELQVILTQNIDNQLNRLLPHHPISKAYRYACLPPGKLFRPLLSAGVFLLHSSDSEAVYTQKDSNASKFAAFLELHHSYTLVHDDMPCMDDDDVRRGKASTHKKFGQWQALLIGDGLQSASWQLLSKINHPQLISLFRYSTWALGPKGLLQGQVLDLSEEMTLSLDNLILTHKLKTARLIQVALVGGYLLSKSPSFKTAQSYHRLGEALGISFQLLDDITELTEKLGKHELLVNPWPKGPEATAVILIAYLEQVTKLIPRDGCLLKRVLKHYFQSIYNKLASEREAVESYIPSQQLRPIETVLKALSHI